VAAGVDRSLRAGDSPLLWGLLSLIIKTPIGVLRLHTRCSLLAVARCEIRVRSIPD